MASVIIPGGIIKGVDVFEKKFSGVFFIRSCVGYLYRKLDFAVIYFSYTLRMFGGCANSARNIEML